MILKRHVGWAGCLLTLILFSIPQAQAQKFSYTGSMNVARYYHAATLLTNGIVLVAGGVGNSGYLSSAELYNPATGTWATTGSMNAAREGFTATLLTNGMVLVAGGFNPANHYLQSAELYNPATGTWEITGSLNIIRYKHTATLLTNGMVLVAGGASPSYLEASELYNPATGTWTVTGWLNTPRQEHSAILLTNGIVLVAGGYDKNGVPLSSVELYDPAAGTWTLTGSMLAASNDQRAFLLTNGMVSVMDNYPPGVELYNPATRTWMTNGSVYPSGGSYTATLLPSGMGLFTGGYDPSKTPLIVSLAELFNPVTGTLIASCFMNDARYHQASTLLTNGMVLVTGGEASSGGILSSAELFSMVIMPGYNQISGNLVSNGKMSLSFVGFAGANYALDRSFSLTPANWIPQVTNTAGASGNLIFTNTPNPTTNNFWRIRSVP
ncbi:MAG: kelch repeat-containing protein [Verrucomicrobiota bacterium]